MIPLSEIFDDILEIQESISKEERIEWLGSYREEQLKYFFTALISKYTSDPIIIEHMWDTIERSYSGRAYHNLSHLNYMIEHASEQSDVLLFAIFYHDLIWDDETKSALRAKKELFFDTALADEVADLILSETPNELSDLDYLILAEEKDVYDDYVLKIRAEYADFSDEEFTEGRIEWLKGILKKDRIFTEPELDKIARKNLKRELNN